LTKRKGGGGEAEKRENRRKAGEGGKTLQEKEKKPFKVGEAKERDTALYRTPKRPKTARAKKKRRGVQKKNPVT